MRMRTPSSSWFSVGWRVAAFFGGVTLAVAGIALIYPPAALIVLGMSLIGVAVHEVYG